MNMLNWSSRQTLFKLFPLIITISFAMDVYVPAMPEMSNYFRTSSANMQASLYLFMLTVALTQLVIGPLADRFGRRQMTLASSLLFLVGSLLCAQASTLTLLMIGRIIQAMGACGTYLLCFIIVRDNFSTQMCGRLFSLLGGINSIIASLAPIIGGILLDLTHNWRSGFYFLIVLGVFIVFASLVNIPEYSHTARSSSKVGGKSKWKVILMNHYFQAYTTIASVCLLGLYLFCALSPEILIKKLHMNGTHFGLWFGLNAITVFLANLVAAQLTHYCSLEKIVRSGVTLILSASILMIGLNINATSVLSFMIPMLCMTIGIGISMGCAVALALRDLEAHSGVATSIVSACQFGVSALFGGIIAQTTLTPSSLAFPVLILTLIGLLQTRSKTALVNHPSV
jgi:MFS transporter, DHA1 family, multidrug resistance protein